MKSQDWKEEYKKRLEELTDEEVIDLAVLGLIICDKTTKVIWETIIKTKNRGTQ